MTLRPTSRTTLLPLLSVDTETVPVNLDRTTQASPSALMQLPSLTGLQISLALTSAEGTGRGGGGGGEGVLGGRGGKNGGRGGWGDLG